MRLPSRTRRASLRGVRRPARVVVAGVVVVVAMSGCQLVDDAAELSASEQDDAQDALPPALGSPDTRWPSTLPGLRAFAEPEALTWQDEPVLADLTVWLQPDLSWERARLTYVAADADRMLTYRTQPDQLRLERPRLAGLQLPELPAAAVEEMIPLPEDALEPAALAAAAATALADCGSTDAPVEAVLYATGAPAAWDGTTWTRTPSWRATVVTPVTGVVVDPTSGQAFAPLTCVEPVLLTLD